MEIGGLSQQQILKLSKLEVRRQQLLETIDQLQTSISPLEKLEWIKVKKQLSRCNSDIKRGQLNLKKTDKLPEKSAELVCRATIYNRKMKELKQQEYSICQSCVVYVDRTAGHVVYVADRPSGIAGHVVQQGRKREIQSDIIWVDHTCVRTRVLKATRQHSVNVL
jgi:hypothetical protein